MASLNTGFEYDLFISYRHNDNRSGWVTEFVNALQEELAVTIKKPITVYFDKNPHDGLLETHNVDKSLERKLKCLIFIPIISQTYCDPKSFAWQHEFCAFNKLAKEDQFGRDIRLSNGNVASRILPIKIHDLDSDDKTTIESEIGGVLRAIEFIFNSPGVSRPLTATDKREENLNKTFYRDQINKGARAIKELIVGMHHSKDLPKEELIQNASLPKPSREKITLAAVIIALLALASFGYYYFGGFGNKITSIDRSIAVLPFVNMSNDPEQEYFSDGMTDEVLNRLFKLGNLKVVSRTSSMKFKGAKLTAKEIGSQLGAANILEGSVQKDGSRLKITVQLIDAATDNHLWSETYEREFKDIFSIQADIASSVAKELGIKLNATAKAAIATVPTQNQVAYEYYLRGEDYWTKSELKNAIQMYSNAIQRDSLFALAFAHRAINHLEIYFKKFVGWEEHLTLADKDLLKLKRLDPNLPELKLALAWRYYYGFGEYDKALAQLKELQIEMPNNPLIPGLYGYIMRRQGKWDESTEQLRKVIELNPLDADAIFNLALSYNFLHQYQKALETAKGGLSVSPGHTPCKWHLLIAEMGLGNGILNAIKNSGLTDQELGYYGRYMTKDFSGCLNELDRDKDRIKSGQSYYAPIALEYATIHFLKGDLKKAKIYADSSVQFLQNKQLKMENDHRLFASLSLSYALLGNETKAIENGQKAQQLMPLSRDAIEGSEVERKLAEMCVIIGRYDLAIEYIEHLLSTPSPLTFGAILIDPLYEKLRNDLRFKKIIQKYKF